MTTTEYDNTQQNKRGMLAWEALNNRTVAARSQPQAQLPVVESHLTITEYYILNDYYY